MIKIIKNQALAAYTTMKVPAKAKYFTIIKDLQDLEEARLFAQEKSLPIFVLGGGSNTVFVQPFNGLVIKNELRGLSVIKKNSRSLLIEAAAGEPWMKLVRYSLEQGAYGLENLAFIYGTVGAAPIQNIGAYGVELKDFFESLEAIDLKTGRRKTFFGDDCHFAYRDSFFKRAGKGRYLIISLRLKLSSRPVFNLDYGGLKQELAGEEIDSKKIIEAVGRLRRSKIPEPGILPNCGSFFKNIQVPLKKADSLKKHFPDMPFFSSEKKSYQKIPAAWLIEACGFKGRDYGGVGMYEKQALIMVNRRQASGRRLLSLAERIKKAVKKRFGLDLQEEVNII